MNHLDELFRGGLGDRKPEVPADLWNKIAARKGEVPEGDALDRLFADKLAHRQAAIPANLWDRIVAARHPVRGRYASALLLLLLAALAWSTIDPAPRRGNATVAVPQVQGSFPIIAHTGFVTPMRSTPPTDVLNPSALPPQAGPAPAPAAEAASRNESVVLFDDRTPSDVPPPATWTAAPAPFVTPAIPGKAFGVAAGTFVPAPPPVMADHSFTARGSRRPQGEVLLGAMYAHQRFSLREDANRSLRDAREVSEFPQLSFQVSARVHYRLTERLSLLSGLTYARIRNQLEYETKQGGVATLVRSTNRLQLLEVPVLAGLRLSGGRLRLTLNAGPVINAYSSVRGSYLHPDWALPLDLRDGGGYRSSVGLGWTASLTTTYKLGAAGTTRLLLEPFFKTYPRSFTRPDAPLGEHYWTAGLQLGLRRSF
ncbi:hypothetical protein [Lewinella sp. IMCC34183]|uniref:hypothetical protein n=1 Tax=Lewinella sp. IMCC34183 TaxID=2248762 RepID=UPI000E251EFA|nr:hypothetical protein [Lewinella sp. IMCC34183]